MTRTGVPGKPWEELEIKFRDLGEQTAAPRSESNTLLHFRCKSFEQELLVVGSALMSGSPDETGGVLRPLCHVQFLWQSVCTTLTWLHTT